MLRNTLKQLLKASALLYFQLTLQISLEKIVFYQSAIDHFWLKILLHFYKHVFIILLYFFIDLDKIRKYVRNLP